MQFSKFVSLLIYFEVYIFSSFCLAICSKSNSKGLRVFFYLLSAVAVVFFAAMRYEVGTDYITYTQIYKSAAKMPLVEWFSKFDFSSTPLAVWALAKIAVLFDSVSVFFGLFAIVIYVPISLMILKNKDRFPVFLTSFAFLTTTFTGGFNIMKQVSAVSLVLFALRYIFGKKPIKFVFTILIASCFHPTAIVTAPICLLASGKDTKKNFSFRAVIVFLAYTVCLLLLSRILSAIGERFEGYLTYDEQINNYSIFLSCLWLIVFLLFRKKLITNNSDNVLYLFLFIVGLMFELLGYISPYIKRIALYFSSVSVFLIPQISKTFMKKDKDVVEIATFMYYVFLFILSYYVLGHSNIIPFAVR